MKLLKKIIATAVTFTLMIVTLATNTSAEINLNQDTTPPKVKSISIDKKEATVGDKVKVILEIEDESKVPYVSVYYRKPMTKNLETISLSLVNGKYEGEFSINKGDEEGCWELYMISATDEYKNNQLIYTGEEFDFRKYDFITKDTSPDINGPVLKSVSIDKNQVENNDKIKFVAEIEDESRVPYISVYYRKPISKQLESISLKEVNGKYEGELLIKSGSEEGSWELYMMSITDEHKNSTIVYTTPELDFNICNFNVSNVKSDITSPVLKSISINKSEGKAGDKIKFIAEIEDESEVPYISVYYRKPISKELETISLKKVNGKYEGEFIVRDGDEKGIWELYMISATDEYKNSSLVYTTTELDFSICNFIVKSNTKPVINAENIVIKVGEIFDPMQGVIAWDEEDGDLTSKIIWMGKGDLATPGEYPNRYEVTDSDGNTTVKETKLIVKSNEKPVINAEDIVIKVGETFDPMKGVTAWDEEDEDLTSKIIWMGKGDLDTPGEYPNRYEVTDSDGNTTVKETKLIVCDIFTEFKIYYLGCYSRAINGIGEPGATVEALVNGDSIGQTIVKSNGEYGIGISEQKLGATITVKMSKTGFITEEKVVEVTW